MTTPPLAGSRHAIQVEVLVGLTPGDEPGVENLRVFRIGEKRLMGRFPVYPSDIGAKRLF
jgi:hypothetical protein